MRTLTRLLTYSCVVLMSLGAPISADGRPYESSSDDSPVLAVVSGAPITEAAIAAEVTARTAQAQTAIYDAKVAALDARIDAILLGREAERKHLTVEELLSAEEARQHFAVTEKDLLSIYAARKERYTGVTQTQALQEIRLVLEQRHFAAVTSELVQKLRQAASIRVFLEPPRVAVDVSNKPVRGAESALITILEVADFECPFSAQMQPLLQRALLLYGSEIKQVFQHMPISRHRNANKAAEAAECAGEQGRFWDMHDYLFQHQDKLSAADLKMAARVLSIDSGRFDGCIDSGRFAETVAKQTREAVNYGATGTPTLFINGRFVNGAVTYEALTSLIADEYARASQPGGQPAPHH